MGKSKLSQRVLQLVFVGFVLQSFTWRSTGAFAPLDPTTEIAVNPTEQNTSEEPVSERNEEDDNVEDEEEEVDPVTQEFTLNWTRAFFGLARRPRQGNMRLSFNKALITDLAQFEPRLSQDSPDSPRKSRRFPVASANVTESETDQNRTRITTLRKLEADDPDYVFADVEEKEAKERQERMSSAISGDASLLKANQQHLSTMINTVFSSPRDFLTNHTVRVSAVRYMVRKFEQMGLVTGIQEFEPLEYADVFGELSVPNGTNVVGLLPGKLWGTKEDEILIIGAHWDTYPNSTGMDDNGSGVAAIMEIARALTEGSCRPQHTIIFAAFDLEEAGCLGSIYFIRDLLIPHILTASGGAKLKGAFILDTIMNFNDTESSQTLSKEWKRLLPEFQQSLKQEKFKGDFLTALYRKDVDSTLASTLAYYWDDSHLLGTRNALNKLNNDESESLQTVKSVQKFNLKKVRLNLTAEVESLDTLAHWVDLLRSDHARFWFHNLDYEDVFPAVLITDTGPYRGLMQQCYHQPCDSAEANKDLKFGNIPFLTKTCQALIDSVLNLSQAQCARQNQWGAIPSGAGNPTRPGSMPALLGTILTVLQWIGLSF